MSVIVGAYEVKTRFSELLDRVSGGETIIVSRHGAPVAQLLPVQRDCREDRERAIDEIIRQRNGCRLDGLSVRQMIEEGRA